MRRRQQCLPAGGAGGRRLTDAPLHTDITLGWSRIGNRMSILIKGGTIVTATDLYRGDVYVEGETISQVGKCLSLPADRIVDATDKYVIPGGIDAHTHLAMPYEGTVSADDFQSGTTAAAYGGTTTIIDFAIQDPGRSMRAAFETWMAKAEGHPAHEGRQHPVRRSKGDGAASHGAVARPSRRGRRSLRWNQGRRCLPATDNPRLTRHQGLNPLCPSARDAPFRASQGPLQAVLRRKSSDPASPWSGLQRTGATRRSVRFRLGRR